MMATPPKVKADRKTISASDAARELGVHLGTLIKWVEEGHLPMFIPPGKELGDGRRGPEGLHDLLGGLGGIQGLPH